MPRSSTMLVCVIPVAVLLAGCHGQGDSAAVSSMSASANTSAIGFVGDLDGDGNPGVVDVVGILRMVVGLDQADPRVDCDGDGAVGIGDAIMLLRCVVGLEVWPIGSRSMEIGPEGGWLTSSDGVAQLALYANASASATTFTISPVTSYPPHPHMLPGSVYDVGPDGFAFGGVAWVRIFYDRGDIPARGNENGIRVCKLVGDVWEDAGPTQEVNDWGHQASVRVDGLSTYCLISEPLPELTYQYHAQFGEPGSGDGEFDAPYGIAVDVAGNLYVTDAGNARVQKFSADGSFVAVWGDNVTLPSPRGIAVVEGTVYVVDVATNRVRTYNSNGIPIIDWGGQGAGEGQFDGAGDVAGSVVSEIIVSDTGNHRVQRFRHDGAFQEMWGGPGGGDEHFSAPDGVAYGSLLRLFVVDRGNCRVKKYSGGPQLILTFGEAGAGAGQFSAPHGIADAPDRTVFVCDTGNNRIQRFTSQGTFLEQFGEPGSGPGQLDGPTDCAVAGNGDVYVVDRGNDRIQVFRPTAL